MRTAVPSGIVAFLFTDIEGSTRRWERHGETMRDAVRRHDEILREEIEARRGYIFKTIGDAFCAAFWSAADALDAAVGAQRRLDRTDFRAVDDLSVRMAIDAGQTDERDGDYFGTAVNRAARLVAAGHGGQILLSGQAADLALASLPQGITLRHLGTLALRDVKEPERVYQPVASGLQSEFKPLRALETPPNNLPHQATSFVGRHDDLAHIEALLERDRLVTVVGAGGIGKTRLALEVARERLNDERDGAWFVDLAAIGDASLIADTIFSTLGAQRSGNAEPIADCINYLEKRELLLVLDNSEHLVADVALIVARIIARCPRVTVLATSREPLDIAGERIYRLSSLDAGAAMQLFADRARAANPAVRLESKTSIVEKICDRLDGVALAIELAAARVRSMSLESLSSHLELGLLAGGRDRQPRQQTMRALIDWSYDLLKHDEQRTLRRSAVFVHGFTLGLARQVCVPEADDERQLLERLTSLVEKSLVVTESRDEGERYRLLEPIREYGWEKLTETGELADVRCNHARALASLAAAWYDEWDKGPAADWLARLTDDLSNLRAAIRWSLEESNDRELGARLVADATIVFLRLALLSEGVEYCARILQPGIVLPARLEGRLRYGLSMLYSNLGANEKCLDEALVAASRFREAGDARGLVRALSQVASRYAHALRDDGGKALSQEALRLARELGDRRLLADTLRRCAESFTGDGAEAVRAQFQESVRIFRSLGRDDDTARALNWWGSWELKLGEYAAAAERLTEALPLAGRDASLMFITNDITSCYLATGNRARAEIFARQSLLLATKARHEIVTFLSMVYLAITAYDSDVRKAARLMGYAEERLRAAGWELVPPDTTLAASLHDALATALKESELNRLLSEGAGWSDEQAVAAALSA